jgi:DNA-binding IclR family transcriptional regulator
MDHKTEQVTLIDRTLNVLEELARSGSTLTFTELCAVDTTAKATMHRLLQTLQARGYVTQDRHTGRYAAGVRCFELGSMWAQNLDVRVVAAPHLARLNELSRETVHLGVYEHGDVVYIDRLESPQQVIAKSYVGRRCPATCVATGRVLLAYSEHAEIDRVLGEPLPKFTEHSIVDPDELGAMLRQVRVDGYGVNRCSYRDEVSGIAAPVRDHTGRVVASVGLCMPDHRFSEERFQSLRELTVQAAVDVSRALGGPQSIVTARAESAAVPTSPRP